MNSSPVVLNSGWPSLGPMSSHRWHVEPCHRPQSGASPWPSGRLWSTRRRCGWPTRCVSCWRRGPGWSRSRLVTGLTVPGAVRPFFDLLNAGKESVAIDLSAPDEVACSDCSRRRSRIEASPSTSYGQPRGQLGRTARGSGTSWVSIPAMGGSTARPVGFGDDAGRRRLWLDGADRSCSSPTQSLIHSPAWPLPHRRPTCWHRAILRSSRCRWCDRRLGCRPPEQATVEGDDESGWRAMLDGERRRPPPRDGHRRRTPCLGSRCSTEPSSQAARVIGCE